MTTGDSDVLCETLLSLYILLRYTPESTSSRIHRGTGPGVFPTTRDPGATTDLVLNPLLPDCRPKTRGRPTFSVGPSTSSPDFITLKSL